MDAQYFYERSKNISNIEGKKSLSGGERIIGDFTESVENIDDYAEDLFEAKNSKRSHLLK